MARQNIDTTTDHGSYKGDPAKVAFDKANANFIELYGRSAALNENYLIDPEMRVNQSGFAGGAIAAGVYGYDMWKAGASGCNLTATNGVISHVSGTHVQVIEMPGLAGAKVTVSAIGPTAPLQLNVGGAQATIPAGSGVQQATLTIPTGVTGHVTFQVTATSSTYRGLKMELGEAATPYMRRPIAVEVALVQRYYERISGLSIMGGAYNAVDIMFGCEFKVTKRATPSVSVITTGTWVGPGSNGNNTTIVLSSPSVNGFQGDVTAFTGSVVQGMSYSLRGCVFAADARL